MEQKNTKLIPTGAVLTLATGIVMVDKFAGVHEAYEWVMGHPVWTHEMPRFAEEARDRIIAQYPDMPVRVDSSTWRDVLADAIVRYGETVMIEKGNATRTIDPVSSLVRMIRPEPTQAEINAALGIPKEDV